MAPAAATQLTIFFTHICGDKSRQCTVLPFLFGKQPSNTSIPRHFTLTSPDDYQRTRREPPFQLHTPAMVPMELIRRTFTDEIGFNTDNTMINKLLKYPLLYLARSLLPNRYVANASATPPFAKCLKPW